MSVDPPLPDLESDDWWREAEKRSLRAVRRSRRRARARRLLQFFPHVLAIALVVAVGVRYFGDGETNLATFLPTDGSVAEDADTPLIPLTREQLKSPFSGTPAEKYAIGAAGIVTPPAQRVGRHSAAEVAKALATTRDLLVLSRLDERVLERRDVAPLAAAVAPKHRQDFTSGQDMSTYLTRLAPGERLLAPPRVTGTMTPGVGAQGEITVNTDYLFVYALRPRQNVYDRKDTHTVVRAKVTFAYFWGENWMAEYRGSWFSTAHSHWSSCDCDLAEKGLLAAPRPVSGQSYGEPDDTDYYTLDQPVPTVDGCPGDDPRSRPSPTPSPQHATVNAGFELTGRGSASPATASS